MQYNYSLKISYDGSPFFGYMACKEGPSIEGSLKTELEKIFPHPIKLQATSRTDKGVHAEEQYVNFFSPLPIESDYLLSALKTTLHPAIVCHDVTIEPKTFHPTLDVKKKRYRYQFSFSKKINHFQIQGSFDIALAKQACSLLKGKQDFFAFCCKRKKYENFIKNLFNVDLEQLNDTLILKVEGDQFLNKMVRMISCTIFLVGKKELKIEEVKKMLNERLPHPKVQPLLANALFLEKIFY
jgi:tRNA pseudouridine38-40 synthase